MKVRHYQDSDNLAEILKAYKLPTIIVTIGLVLAVIGFMMALKYDMAQSERVFRDYAEQVYRTLDTEVRRHEQQVGSIARMLGQIKILTESEFTDIANAFTENTYFSHISLYSLQDDGALKETFSSANHVRKLENTAGSLEFKQAIENASKIGRTYFSQPYEIMSNGKATKVAVIVSPIAKKYNKNLFLVNLLDLDELFTNSFDDDKGVTNVRVYSVYNLEKKLIYEQYEAQQKEFFTAISQDRYETLHHEKIRFFDDYQWEIHLYSSMQGFVTYVGLFPWIAFLSGLAVTGLIGYIAFRITVENVKTRILVDRQTKSLREYTEKLEASNRDLDDFAYIASHDLKEPLRGIYNYSEFLLEDYKDKLDDDGRYKLQTLKKLSRRMEALIDTLMEFSRLSREDMAFKTTDIGAAVHDTLDTIAIWLRENRAQVQIAAPLPEIMCDHARVAEIFRNLITNAVKYNNKSEKMVEIGCVNDHVRMNGVPVFYVRDNGIGIPPEHQDAIFKIFKRLHSRDDYGGGTGSGLTIVKKIIDRHNGVIWVESSPDEGTTFFFTLSGKNNDNSKQDKTNSRH